MGNLIIELVKYFILLLSALYAYLACYVISIKEEKQQKKRYRFMAVLMYLVHGSGYMILILHGGIDYFVLYIAQVAGFILISLLYQKCYSHLSILIFHNMRMFLAIGFIMIARLSLELAVRQFLFAILFLGICLGVPALIRKFKLWESFGLGYLLIGVILLGILLIAGKEVHGAKNWIEMGKIQLQPSEFVKIFFILGSASLLSKKTSIGRIMMVTVFAALQVLLLVAEKDLGAAFLFFVTYLILLYCATGKKRYLIIGVCAGCAAAILAYYLFPHVQVRVMAFKNPFAVIEKEGYQLAQSLFAIGTGGWFGLGVLGGLPQSIPVAESDFIFSAIAEELGGITAICLLFIALSCYIMFVRLSVKVKQPFYKLTALGFSAMYIFQVFLNAAGVIKLVPSTGITFPLISSGGSSLASSILMFSVIQGIHVLDMEDTASITNETLPISQTKHNQSIFRMTYVFAGMLFLCAGYLIYFEFFQAKTIINNTYNQRQEVLAKKVIRGKILSSDGKILAQTVEESGEEIRIYPYGAMFSHTVGRIEKGRSGIEATENFNLLTSSLNGISKLKLQLQGEKVPADTIITTLNTVIQQAAYDALDGKKGAVVVLEASTGKVLAMVSKPDYNPNTVIKDWEELIEDKENKSALLNRATQGLYPPGSTFKMLTLLEYIREHPNDYEEYSYQCKGSERVGQVTVHCANNKAHGKENLLSSFTNSCNSSFAAIGGSLNLDGLHELCETFLFNQPLPGTLSQTISSYTLTSQTIETEIAQTVIGLGKTQISPLHNAMIVQSIANGGILMKPYLISEVLSADGRIVKQYKSEAAKTLISKEEADFLANYMEHVVKEGTASKLSNMKVSVAGKTGTAYYETGKNPHAWFVGFAPVEEPELVISVIVESSGTGSSYAVPVAKKILEAYYKK